MGKSAKIKVTLSVIGVITLVGIIFFGLSIRLAIRSENQLQSMRFMSNLLIQHIDTHSGQWPNSWKDLENLESNDKTFGWPDQSAVIKRNVIIEFRVSGPDLARLTPDSFVAFREAEHINILDYKHEKSLVLTSLRRHLHDGAATSP